MRWSPGLLVSCPRWERLARPEGRQGLVAVEQANVLLLGRRESPNRPREVDEVRLGRDGVWPHPDLIGEMIALAGVAARARCHDVGRLVAAAARLRDHVIPCEALTTAAVGPGA